MNQISATRKRHEEQAATTRSSQCIESLFILRMRRIIAESQWRIEEDLFDFPVGDPMLRPVLADVPVVPLKTRIRRSAFIETPGFGSPVAFSGASWRREV